MTKYAKIDENGKVIQVQPNESDGFIKVNAYVACGMVKQDNGSFILPEPEPEPENPKAVGEVYTLNGIDYQVPFMKDDADGMVQVTLGFMKGAFTNTTIHFSNGTKLPITASEFDAFAMWFAEKRNSFFIGE